MKICKIITYNIFKKIADVGVRNAFYWILTSNIL